MSAVTPTPRLPGLGPAIRLVASGRRGRAITALALPLVLAGLLAAYVATHHQAQATPPAPAQADRFMQSLIARDGELGWRQLCPVVQAEIPPAQIVQVAQAQRAAETQQGLSLTMNFAGSRRRPEGGELRSYVVLAHHPDGSTEQRTFTVTTQASGCVEAVQQ